MSTSQAEEYQGAGGQLLNTHQKVRHYWMLSYLQQAINFLMCHTYSLPKCIGEVLLAGIKLLT